MFNTQSDNVAGYCKHHRCGMTVKQIKLKNCLQKQCWYFIKNEQHEWWTQRSHIKQKRQERRERIRSYGI